MFLIAEPLRNLGKYTFADVVAYRLRQTPVRIAVGDRRAHRGRVLPDRADGRRRQPLQLLFGLPYETAVLIVGVVMLAYVLFGGMIATTWVQIVKAVLLLGGAPAAGADRARALRASTRWRSSRRRRRATAPGVLAPGKLVSDPARAPSRSASR